MSSLPTWEPLAEEVESQMVSREVRKPCICSLEEINGSDQKPSGNCCNCRYLLSQQWELRQEDGEFEATLGSITSSRPAWLHSEFKISVGYKIQAELWRWLRKHLL